MTDKPSPKPEETSPPPPQQSPPDRAGQTPVKTPVKDSPNRSWPPTTEEGHLPPPPKKR